MNHKKRILATKYISYIVAMIFLYVLQTTPGFLSIFDVKPNLVAAAAICIAMREDEFTGGVYGVLAGILCDLGGFALFGFNAIIFMAGGVVAGLLAIYLLRQTVINFVLLLAGMLLARGLLDYLLNFYMWGYEQVWRMLVYDVLPGVIYSAAVSPLIYWLYTWMHNRFEERLAS